MSQQTLLWIGFNVFVVVMLYLDLFVFNRKSHVIKVKEALWWTAMWVSIALAFNGLIWYLEGSAKALDFLTCYLVEESLSVDNLFVFLMLFTYFRTPTAFQHKVLFWGIIGAIFFRVLFIFLGITIIEKFHFATYILGGFLIFTAIKMFFSSDDEPMNPEDNIATKLLSKIMPVTQFYDGSKFFTIQNGKRFATPLFIVLLVVETTDIIFATDSIPAILAITRDPFIVYSSNILAVMGLRSLYFALAGVMELFHYLHHGLSLILLFIGVKIILANHYPIETWIALVVVAGVLLGSIVLSLMFPEKTKVPPHHPHDAPFPVKTPKEPKA